MTVAIALAALLGSNCSVSPPISVPSVGLVISTIAGGKYTGTETVAANLPVGSVFSLSIDVPDTTRKNKVDVTSLYGFLELVSPANVRVKSYPDNVTTRLVGMRVGESIVIPFSETFAFKNETYAREGITRVTFKGCDDRIVAGEREPVVNFRVSTSIHASDGQPTPTVTVKQIEMDYAVSPRLGWRIWETGDNGTVEVTAVNVP